MVTGKKFLSLMASIAAAYFILSGVSAASVLDLKEERCYLSSDLQDAIQNNRCWVMVDGYLYDMSSDVFWKTKSHLGYKCGDNISSGELAGKGITLRSLLDYYGDMSQVSRIGKICDNRSVPAPPGCGDERCDVSQENFVNCPQDCPPAALDGWCVPFDDFVCDPDCGRDLDPNCACDSNGYCDKPYENHVNCPVDCPPENRDGFCTKRADGICDPDCLPGQDPDCSSVATDTTTRPTTSTRPVTPTISTDCGNGLCEEGENYLNCRKDCPSGSYDGYCDAVKDGICDPDCRPGDDPDCLAAGNESVPTTAPVTGKQGDNILGYLIYIVPAALLLIVAYVIYRRTR